MKTQIQTRIGLAMALALALLAGLAPRAEAVSATGGTVTNYTENTTNFTAHIFTNSGVFTNLTLTSVEVLVVAGGGGGGDNGNTRGSGGGAGGLIYISSFPVESGNYAVTVGAGGAEAVNGSNSVFSGAGRTLTANGGGRGGYNDSTQNGNPGGSGGGQWYPGYVGAASTQPANTSDGIDTYPGTGFGNAGGTSGNAQPYGSGGGGAGSPGSNYNAVVGGPVGGIGKAYDISGTNKYYAGGGGGAGFPPQGDTKYNGGLGGGGRGWNNGTEPEQNGTANTGGGGGAGGSGGSGIVIVRYVTEQKPIENRTPSGVTTNGATFNGYLVTNGAASAVYVAWGQTNGSVSGSWATTNWWNPGDWTNGSYPSTNMTLAANANYYYTFGATNSATNVTASGYQYLITGEVTVQPTDPTGRVTMADTAAFTLYRPASCTNEALTVAYTLGGTAVNGTHYTNSPATTGTNGTVTLAAGQTNAVITVYPLNLAPPQHTVVLSLVSGNYAISSANAATCTLAGVVSAYKLPIAFTNYTRAEVLTNFPVLVTFSNGLYEAFNYNTFTAPASGGDLRFEDSAESTYLDFEIEKWDTNGASYVWVRVPQLSSNTTIYAKWGGSDTNLPACTTNGAVWANGFGAVWHLNESVTPGATLANAYKDATPNLRHAKQVGVSPANGLAGGGMSADGNDSNAYRVELPASATSGRTVFTAGLWVKTTESRTTGGSTYGDQFWNKRTLLGEASNNDHSGDWGLKTVGGKIGFWHGLGNTDRTYDSPGLSINDGTSWHHVALVNDNVNMSLYVDGAYVAQVVSGSYGTDAYARWLGGMNYGDFGSGGGTYHQGAYDEVRISTNARSANWVWAEYANMASNAFFNGYGTVIAPATATAPPQIQNQAPTGVGTNGATFNGKLVTNGFENAAVYVAWGQTNGSVNGPWASTNWWNPGDWTNGSYPSTNMTLAANANYYYRFGATNSMTNVLATLPQSYQYLITGEVTVQPTDPTGRVNLADAAAFTVYRPTSCTNEALTVAFTLGGTATNGIQYTNSPAASGTNGTVTLAAGQTNTVITVYPLPLISPEQTVVLTLSAGSYAIGADNSATCTLAAIGITTYTWKTASGNWSTAGNWDPSGPPGGLGVGRITNNSPCVANSNLPGNPEIQVYTNCILDVATDLSSQTIVLNNGGTLRNDTAASTTRTVSDTVKIQGTGYVVGRGQQNTSRFDGLIQDGTSAGKLIAQWAADGSFAQTIYLRATNNTYSGGTEIQAGRMNWPQGLASWADRLYATAPGCLGTGSVLVRSNAWLNLATTNTTGPGAVITVESGGKVEISANTAGHTILLKDGGALRKDWTTHSTRTSADTIQLEGSGYVVGGLNETMLNLNGLIQDGATPGRLVLDTEAFQNWGVGISLNRGTNTYSGGTEVRPTRHTILSSSWIDWVYAKADGCLGTGPLIVHPNGWLNLLLATAADWTLTNNISMGLKTAPQSNGDWTVANIKVQVGAHRLTAAGSVVTPGAFTNAASVTTNTTGKLAIDGKFAFARNNGAVATLAIGIAGAGGVAGVDYSQLSVSSGDATLAASITNCDLIVSVTTNSLVLSAPVTNLVASGANFSSYQFRSVTWSGSWTGSVQYGSGFIALTGMVQTVGAITLGPLGNVTTNSAQASALLTGMSADMYMFWDTQDRGQNFTWAYTNTPLNAFTNTQPLTAITNTATGLAPGTQYTYRFYGTNASSGWAGWSAAGTFETPAGPPEVSVLATDPDGRVTLADTAVFAVARPIAATNYDLTVNYTLGGTATNGIQYTNSPAASGTNGTVTIAAGQTNAVVTVYPLPVVSPQQTVVLTLASGDYAIGSANSATCTLAALGTTIYTWQTADGNWSAAGNWNPSGGPPGALSVGRILSNGPCRANSDLSGNPQVEVYTNCILDLYTSLSSQTIVLDGGAIRKDTAGSTTRTVSDTIKIQGTGYVVGRANECNINLDGLIQDGTSPGKLIAQWAADGKWLQPIYLRYTNNTYSGGTEVQAERMSRPDGQSFFWADRLYASAPGCLGTSNVLVRSNGWLNLATTNTTGPGAVITVENGGKVEIGANTAGHTILLKDGGQLRKDWSSSSSRTSADTIQLEGSGYVVGGLNETTLNLNGLIQDGATAGRLVLDTEVFQNWGVGISLNRGTNTYSGGTEVRPTRHTNLSSIYIDWVYAKADGCLGTGPLIVHPNGWLNLLLATAADWTLTNNISMGLKTAPQSNGDWTKANIKVQAGAHRLTAAGSVITPGAFTNTASLTTNTTGTLAINGKFAFARNNGTCATLAIGIAGTNGVAGVDYSQLSVGTGDSILAASITNCDLIVTVVSRLVTEGMIVTNLVASGADFSSYRFSTVTWSSGWNGNVQYGNGAILLTDIRTAEGSVFRFR